MDINRNQYFMMGIVVLLVGLQFRAVSAYVLNEQATQYLAKRHSASASSAGDQDAVFSASPASVGAALGARKVIQMPEWSGWALISVGAVLVLHSLSMKRPD